MWPVRPSNANLTVSGVSPSPTLIPEPSCGTGSPAVDQAPNNGGISKPATPRASSPAVECRSHKPTSIIVIPTQRVARRSLPIWNPSAATTTVSNTFEDGSSAKPKQVATGGPVRTATPTRIPQELRSSVVSTRRVGDLAGEQHHPRRPVSDQVKERFVGPDCEFGLGRT